MKKKEFNTFGELEARIMEVIWRLNSASVRDVLNQIKGKKRPAYTTVMTVMSRLHNKGILKRSPRGDAYIYAPVQNKQRFLATTSRKIIHNLINEFGEDVAVAGFLDAIEGSNVKESEELRNILKKVVK